MKKYIAALLMISVILAGFAHPQAVRADSGDDNFAWTLTAEAGTALDAGGDVVPAVCLYFDCSEEPDYVEIYRSESEYEDFFQIGSYIWGFEEEAGCFYDTAINLGETYYYCAVACWYATETEPWRMSGISNVAACRVQLGKPQIEVVGGGTKYVKILLPASSFAKEFPYPKVDSEGVYVTGFQIYRSRKEDSGYKLIASVTADEEGYKDGSVTKGKLYFYKVRAFYYDKTADATYEGPFSDIRMCCPGSKNFPDVYSLNLMADWKSDTSAKVSWDNVDGFVAETLCYSCRRPGEKFFGNPKYVDLSKKAESCTIKELERDCEYEIRLLVRVKTPYNDGNDNFYYDSRWYVCTLDE